jgi:hypothetical protein
MHAGARGDGVQDSSGGKKSVFAKYVYARYEDPMAATRFGGEFEQCGGD